MLRERVENTIKEIIPKSKDFYLDDSNNIIYTYKGEKYTIRWDKRWSYRLGDYIEFSNLFINDIRMYKRYTSLSTIGLTESSYLSNPKKILSKIRVLSKRIREQNEVVEFQSKVQKEFKPKVINWVLKEFGVQSIDEFEKFQLRDNYEWNTNKKGNTVERTFRYVKFNVYITKDNISYSYGFSGYYPCKWNDTELKMLVLDNSSEKYLKSKQITNIIRYAKLKNLFND